MVVINGDIKEISKDLTDTWPPGQKTGAKPATRFDVPKQYYFNMTHMFFPNDFRNIRKLTEPELVDIEVSRSIIVLKLIPEGSTAQMSLKIVLDLLHLQCKYLNVPLVQNFYTEVLTHLSSS